MIRKLYRRFQLMKQRLFLSMKKTVPVYIPVLQNELLVGRKALITGGTGGIGFAIAEAFVRAGAAVVITGRGGERLDEAVEKLKTKQGIVKAKSVFGLAMNNVDVDSFPEHIEKAKLMMGGLDILVNNAGVVNGCGFGNTQKEDYDTILETNLRGPYFLSQFIARDWIDNKIEGNILNVCSTSSLRPGQNPYILSKWGLRALTLGLAKSFSRYGIVVNGIAPGPTDTESMASNLGGAIDWKKNPAGRLVTRREIANMSVVLVSDLSRMVIGDIIYMGGGAGVITFDDV